MTDASQLCTNLEGYVRGKTTKVLFEILRALDISAELADRPDTTLILVRTLLLAAKNMIEETIREDFFEYCVKELGRGETNGQG